MAKRRNDISNPEGQAQGDEPEESDNPSEIEEQHQDTPEEGERPQKQPDGLVSKILEMLPRLSGASLMEVIDAATSLRQEREEEIKRDLLAEFREKAARMGVSFDVLFRGVSGKHRSDYGRTVAPKFRSPNGETWTGRGREPNWLRALEETGHSREEYRIIPEGQDHP